MGVMYTCLMRAILTIVMKNRNFWRRHKRKVLVGAGLLGSGYVLYKLYNAHRQRFNDLERELASERKKVDDLVKDQ